MLYACKQQSSYNIRKACYNSVKKYNTNETVNEQS